MACAATDAGNENLCRAHHLNAVLLMMRLLEETDGPTDNSSTQTFEPLYSSYAVTGFSGIWEALRGNTDPGSPRDVDLAKIVRQIHLQDDQALELYHAE